MLTIVQRSAANLDKPTEVVRGQASRLPWAWAGLCFGVALQDANNEGLRDIVNNVAPDYPGMAVWTRDNRGNPAVQYVQDAVIYSFTSWPDSKVHDKPTTALTAYLRMRPTGASTNDGGAFYNPAGTSAPWSSWGIQGGNPDPTTMYGTISLGTTTEYSTPFTASIPTTEWYSVFLRWQSGSTLTMDVLGERGNIVSSVAGGSALTGSIGYYAGWGVRLNAAGVNATNYFGIYSQAMVWDRRLTNTEMSALVADPYGWYAPRRATVLTSSPYGLPFGGGELRGVSGGMGGMY